MRSPSLKTLWFLSMGSGILFVVMFTIALFVFAGDSEVVAKGETYDHIV